MYVQLSSTQQVQTDTFVYCGVIFAFAHSFVVVVVAPGADVCVSVNKCYLLPFRFLSLPLSLVPSPSVGSLFGCACVRAWVYV